MPAANFSVSLAQPGEVEVVPPGNVINGMSVLELTAAARFTVRIGNGPALGPFVSTGRLSLDYIELLLTSSMPELTERGTRIPRELREGLYIGSPTPQPGATVSGFVSYSRPNESGLVVSYTPA